MGLALAAATWSSHHLLSNVVAWLMSLVVIGAFVAALQWAMMRGGAPAQEGGAVIYRLRPAMRLFASGSAVLGCWLFWFAFQNRHGDPGNFVLEIVFGLICAGGGGFTLSTRMVLDEAGLHYFRFPGRETTIAWSEFLHYEVQHSTRAISSVYFFRPRPGAASDDSIGVTDTAYDIADMMQRIQARHPLKQQPYKSRRWYGG